MKRKRTLKKWVIYLFMIISITGIVYSGYYIFNWKKDIDENKTVEKKIEKYVEVTDGEFKVDFNELKKENADTIGYITVPGTNINYIVVKGNDNEYYLSHNFENKYNVHGWIFADSRNKYDGTDRNLIVYGHNTQDGSMFGTLKNTISSSWSKDYGSKEIEYITENETKYYKVFSAYSIEVEEYYITTEFQTDEDYNYFLKTIKSRSFYNYNVDLDANAKILTLSTCTANGTKRVVLHAKLIE